MHEVPLPRIFLPNEALWLDFGAQNLAPPRRFDREPFSQPWRIRREEPYRLISCLEPTQLLVTLR